ncbi:SGNH/GDSL hydrolase family protein [Sorangium sp. So ce118]
MPIAKASSGASGGTLPAGAANEFYSDPNSLVPGRVDQMPWRLTNPSAAPRTRPIYAVTGSTGPRQWVWVNYDSYCPRDGYLERPFTVPAGVTAVRIELDDVHLPSGVSSTNAFAIQLYDATGITQVHSTSATPTTQVSDTWTTSITVTPGAEYRVRIACNVAGQSTFVCGRLRVRPVTTSDSFYENFVRIDADHSIIQDSNEIGWANARYPLQSEFSHIDLLTDARDIRVEVLDNIGDYVSDRGKPSVFVNGEPIDPQLDTTIGAIAHCACTIPSAGGMQHVAVFSGPQAVTGLPAPANENRGSFICGIYLPASARVQVLPEKASNGAETIVLYGDSKMAGFYSTSPGRDSAAFLLRRAGHRVICNTAGGDALFYSVGSTLTVAACTTLAQKLCRKNPTVIILEMGRNDFVAGLYTPANLVTQLGNLLDAIHAQSPNVKVKILTWTHEVTETAESGVSWDTERANVAALATSRSAWCSVIDAARYWSVAEANSYTTDTVHPNDAGQERIARGILGDEYPWSPLQVSSLYLWCEAGPNMGGGPMSAVTASGTSPPTVTLSGTATLACQLRIEVKTAGTLGNSRFRWSINGGRSWVQQDVPTAASVLLSPLGVTVNFSAASYPNNAVYVANVHVGQVNDKSGNSRHLVGVTNQFPPYNIVGINNKPALQFVPTDFMRVTGLNLVAPYSVYVVGKYTTQASVRALLGKTASGSGVLFYSNTPTTMAWNDGVVQRSVTCDATQTNCYIVTVNGSSSTIRVNGTSSTVVLANSTITGIGVGADAIDGNGLDGYVAELMAFSSSLTVDECMALEARSRLKWGTA